MIVLGKEKDFNQLEQEIYDYGCEIARNIMVEILELLDDRVAKERNRADYRDKGKRKTSIKTLMGEVEYSRRVYKKESETGVKEYIYLLDQELEINKIGLYSGNLVQLIVESGSNESFRKTAKIIRSTTGQIISHGGVWNVVQAVGSKLKAEEKEQVKAVTQESNQGSRERKILFE